MAVPDYDVHLHQAGADAELRLLLRKRTNGHAKDSEPAAHDCQI
jgi:hypothetical protein